MLLVLVVFFFRCVVACLLLALPFFVAVLLFDMDLISLPSLIYWLRCARIDINEFEFRFFRGFFFGLSSKTTYWPAFASGPELLRQSHRNGSIPDKRAVETRGPSIIKSMRTTEIPHVFLVCTIVICFLLLFLLFFGAFEVISSCANVEFGS